MEHILDLYQQPYDAAEPVICVDEKSISEVRTPLPMEPGQPQRVDSQYKRGDRSNFGGG